MPEENETDKKEVEFTLIEREGLINRKAKTLKTLLEEKVNIVNHFNPSETGFNSEEWLKKYNQNFKDIQKIIKRSYR